MVHHPAQTCSGIAPPGFLSIVPLTIAGLLSSLMIGQLASQITGGGAGGGIMGMIGQAGQSLSKLKGV